MAREPLLDRYGILDLRSILILAMYLEQKRVYYAVNMKKLGTEILNICETSEFFGVLGCNKSATKTFASTKRLFD